MKHCVRQLLLATLVTIGFAIAGCGGGDGDHEQRHVAPLLTPTQLFNWLESRYPDLFPAGPLDEVHVTPTGEPLIFRHYPTTRNFVAVSGGKVTIAGPVAGGVGEIQELGDLEDFYCQVTPEDCFGPR